MTNLEILRLADHMDIPALSAATGIDSERLQAIEAGTLQPEPAEVRALCQCFSVEESEFLGKLKYRAAARNSRAMLLGHPLFSIGEDARGIVAIGVRAYGVIAIGCFSRGLISLGLFSLGLVSLGCFSLGILSLGLFSFGVLAVGNIAVGVVSFGLFSLGYLSDGLLSLGVHEGILGKAAGLLQPLSGRHLV